ncbi:hypothetical protein RB195_011170 [Necator americanus]|uniref:Uncharacterized protein n=1 Tax=Necator americanus TaxID=51031 RepID=A0ABR1D1G6_NECAM
MFTSKKIRRRSTAHTELGAKFKFENTSKSFSRCARRGCLKWSKRRPSPKIHSQLMGQWISSKLDYSIVSEENSADLFSGTPTSGKRVLTIDPRSPTADINRTPIEITSTPKTSGGSWISGGKKLTLEAFLKLRSFHYFKCFK